MTTGIVPNGGIGVGAKSGVTVSYGVDLSWQYARDLVNAGVPDSVIDQLRPFLAFNMTVPIAPINGIGLINISGHGPQGTAAQRLLTALPINPALSDTVVSNLFSNAYGIAEGRALSGFENLTGSTFLSLPAAAQSVLTDLAFNMGNVSKWPDNIKDAIANQDWATLATLIKPLPGLRGKTDAGVLDNAIQNGALPGNGPCS